MKILIYIFIALAFGLIAYNATYIDMDNVFSGDSAAALIGILASSCVVVLMLILLVSRTIAEKAGK